MIRPDPRWFCGSTTSAATKTTPDDLQNPCSEIKESIAGYARGTRRGGTTTKPPQALYRFFGNAGELLYIGISADPGRRWKQHRDKPWWHEVANVTLEQYPDRPSVEAAERAAIEDEAPRYNVVHNRNSRPPSAPTGTVTADEMPDDCHDACVRYGITSVYFPYRWREGHAEYQCDSGHRWTCGWGHGESGEAPENRGYPIHRLVFDPDEVAL